MPLKAALVSMETTISLLLHRMRTLLIVTSLSGEEKKRNVNGHVEAVKEMPFTIGYVRREEIHYIYWLRKEKRNASYL